MLLRGLVRWFCPWFCVGPPWGGSPLYFGRVILSSSNFHQPFEKDVPFSLGAARAPFVLKEFNGSKISSWLGVLWSEILFNHAFRIVVFVLSSGRGTSAVCLGRLRHSAHDWLACPTTLTTRNPKLDTSSIFFLGLCLRMHWRLPVWSVLALNLAFWFDL